MKQEKSYQLDIIRSIAIILVLLVHASELIFFQKGKFTLLDYGLIDRVTFLFLFSLGRLGVPLFLFLTGYLMLSRDYHQHSLENYYKNRVWTLYKVIAFGIIGLTVYEVLINKIEFSLLLLIKQLLLIDNLPGIQTWYMPVILGIYCFIPLIANAVKQLNKRTVLFLMSLVFMYYFVIRDINLMLSLFDLPTFAVVVDFGFVSTYGFVVLIGWLLQQGSFRQLPTKLLILLMLFGLGTLVYYQFVSFDEGLNYLVWYNNGLLIIVAICVFELFSRIKVKKEMLLFRTISQASFGVFWVHSIGQDLLYPYVSVIKNHFISVILLSISNLIISIIVVKIYKKSKKKCICYFQRGD